MASACSTADLVADLQAVVDRDGVVVDGRPHPAVVEVRQQRLVLGRLLGRAADPGRRRPVAPAAAWAARLLRADGSIVRPRRLPPAPPELPARLRCFVGTDWSDPDDDPEWADYLARRRHTTAWVDWCRDVGVDPVAVLRQRHNDRRGAAGLEPLDYVE